MNTLLSGCWQNSLDPCITSSANNGLFLSAYWNRNPPKALVLMCLMEVTVKSVITHSWTRWTVSRWGLVWILGWKIIKLSFMKCYTSPCCPYSYSWIVGWKEKKQKGGTYSGLFLNKGTWVWWKEAASAIPPEDTGNKNRLLMLWGYARLMGSQAWRDVAVRHSHHHPPLLQSSWLRKITKGQITILTMLGSG